MRLASANVAQLIDHIRHWWGAEEGEEVAEMERDFLRSLRAVRTLDTQLRASMDQVHLQLRV